MLNFQKFDKELNKSFYEYELKYLNAFTYNGHILLFLRHNIVDIIQ